MPARRFLNTAFLCLSMFVIIGLAGCNTTSSGSSSGLKTQSSPDIAAEAESPQPNAQSSPQSAAMILYPGDTLKIMIVNDETLSGEYTLDPRGMITMPLIGEVKAGHRSLATLREEITAKLADGYIVNPQVSIDMTSMRPFYILGEVSKPGTYDTTADLNVFQAIATAGGLTPRARSGRYTIYRGKGPQRREISAGDDTPVLPGDSIRVEERLF